MSEKPVFRDMIGREVKVGQFVVVNISNYMWVGIVTKLGKPGRSCQVRVDSRPRDPQITLSEKILIVDDETKSHAIVRKLSK